MKIEKFNHGSFGANVEGEQISNVTAQKDFTFFGKKAKIEEPEYTKTQFASEADTKFQAGLDEGYRKGKDEITKLALQVEENTKSAANQIIAQLDPFLKQFEEQKKEYMRSMTKVAMIAIKKISEKLIKENTEEVLLQALEKAAEVFCRQPEIIMKAPKNILDKIRDKVDSILQANDFKGKITYIADDTITEGNCIVEWGDSGVSINSSEVLKQVEETISEYLKSI